MCIPGDYWKKKGVNKPCGTFSIEEVHEAYKAAYADHIKDGKWTYEQLIEWFPRERAQMTQEQVVEFANGARSS
jgi:hypothetical protein